MFLLLCAAHLKSGQKDQAFHLNTEPLTLEKMLFLLMLFHLVASCRGVAALKVLALHTWAMNCPLVANEIIRASEGCRAAGDFATVPHPGFR